MLRAVAKAFGPSQRPSRFGHKTIRILHTHRILATKASNSGNRDSLVDPEITKLKRVSLANTARNEVVLASQGERNGLISYALYAPYYFIPINMAERLH